MSTHNILNWNYQCFINIYLGRIYSSCWLMHFHCIIYTNRCCMTKHASSLLCVTPYTHNTFICAGLNVCDLTVKITQCVEKWCNEKYRTNQWMKTWPTLRVITHHLWILMRLAAYYLTIYSLHVVDVHKEHAPLAETGKSAYHRRRYSQRGLAKVPWWRLQGLIRCATECPAVILKIESFVWTVSTKR